MRLISHICFLLGLLLTCTPQLSWANGDGEEKLTCADEAHRKNQNFFYDNMTPGTLRIIQEKKGMLTCPDYRTKEVQALLTEGVPTAVAIYGSADATREAQYLFEHSQVRLIHLVEVGNYYDDDAIDKMFQDGSTFMEELKKRTSRKTFPKVAVDYNQNVAQWRADQSVDVIFWMFAGFMELSPNEKKLAVERAWNNLRTSGAIVIDVPNGSVNSPNLDIDGEGEDTIRFHFKDKTRLKDQSKIPSLVWSPVNRATGVVDFEKVKHYFTANGRFHLYKEVFYYSDAPANEGRRLMIFMKK